jgi:hypothetical protein
MNQVRVATARAATALHIILLRCDVAATNYPDHLRDK